MNARHLSRPEWPAADHKSARQLIVSESAQAGEVMRNYPLDLRDRWRRTSPPRAQAHINELRLIDRLTDLADEEAFGGCQFWMIRREVLGDQAGGDIVKLADMRDWVLAKGALHRHRPVGCDEPIHAIAAPRFTIIASLG